MPVFNCLSSRSVASTAQTGRMSVWLILLLKRCLCWAFSWSSSGLTLPSHALLALILTTSVLQFPSKAVGNSCFPTPVPACKSQLNGCGMLTSLTFPQNVSCADVKTPLKRRHFPLTQWHSGNRLLPCFCWGGMVANAACFRAVISFVARVSFRQFTNTPTEKKTKQKTVNSQFEMIS